VFKNLMPIVDTATDFLRRYSQILLVITLILITFVTLLPVVQGDFLNWDDDAHVYENIQVYSLSGEGMRRILTSTINGTYIPLTTLSFALEWHFFGPNPFVYRLNNLWLHIAVCVLVFYFALRIGLNNPSAFLASLLFAVHPIHVESVAWITERKDVLYAFFYMASLLAYTRYIRHHEMKFYGLSLGAALLSILAKPMAVSLPVILFLYDWFLKRRLHLRVFFDKIPFLGIAISIGLITFRLNQAPLPDSMLEKILIWIWTCVFYPVKFFFPFGLKPFYQLPLEVSLKNPAYVFSLLIFVMLLTIFIRYRKNRLLVLAWAHFFFSSFFLFRFYYTNFNAVADRFMYLPSLGLCFFIGTSLHTIMKASARRRLGLAAVVCLIAALFLGLMIKTRHQVRIWDNSLAFWNYEINNTDNPRPLWLVERGNAYFKAGDIEKALADYEAALVIDSNYAKAYFNKGLVFDKQNRLPKAIEQYSAALIFEPGYEQAYNNRGYDLLALGKNKAAKSDFEQALTLNPDYAEAWNNLGKVHMLEQRYIEAYKSFSRAIEAKPFYSLAYSNRGAVAAMMGNYQAALKDFDAAIRLDPGNQAAYQNRALALRDDAEKNK